MREVEVGKRYKHFKGQIYKVLMIALDSETNEEQPKKVVVYQALYGDNLVWVRDYDVFLSNVDKDKYPEIKQEYRFERI
ncbi:MAG: DUF1653 domain-containing protein [Bacilli bacterium]